MLTQLIGIRSSPARVLIHSELARIEIDNQPGVLTIEGGPAEMEITSEPLRLEVDSTVPRQELGYYTPLALLADMASYTAAQVSQAISRRMAEGRALQQIENGGGAIAWLAHQTNTQSFQEHQFILTMLPHTPPEIHFTPGAVNTSIRARLVKVQFTAQQPMITVRDGQRSVEVEPSQLRIFVREPRTLDLTV